MKVVMGLAPSSCAALLLLTLLSASLNARPAVGQFTCTLAARDEDGCLAASDDDGSSCVWCSLSGFGFCVNEAAAEAAESTVPGIDCDRATPPSEDDTTPSPPEPTDPPSAPTAPTKPKPKPPHPKPPPPPKTDDNIKPNDDSKVPSNFWNCLSHKNSQECKADKDKGADHGDGGCTWCRSRAGYAICMSGPTAESAKHSDFFQCDDAGDNEQEGSTNGQEAAGGRAAAAASASDPYDPACVVAFWDDPTEEGCTSATDADGNSCEWCTLAGITNLCLSKDQADQGAPLGITCQDDDGSARASSSSSSSSSSTVDSGEGNLFDTSCVMTLLQDPTESGCAAASDEAGASCQWCGILQNQVHVCVTHDQAEMGRQALGMECAAGGDDEEVEEELSALKDPYDPTCMLAFLQDATQESCEAASDKDGNPCEYCTIAGFNVCLTIEQAQMSQGAGATCTSAAAAESSSSATLSRDYQDASCLDAYAAGGGSSEACLGAVDEDRQPCQLCTRDNLKHLCLTASQGDLISTLGFWCDTKSARNEPGSTWAHEFEDEVALPDDFFKCLQSYEPDDCQTSGCTWCDSQVGIGFCTSDAVADSMKPCTFFDCQYKNQERVSPATSVADFDPTCMNAGFSHPQHGSEACHDTLDQGGESCVWCHTADNAVGLCFSQDQAARASSLLECDGLKNGIGSMALAASE